MRYPLSLFQRSMLDLDTLRPGFLTNPHATLSVAVRLTGPLDVDALNHAFDELVARHEVLRTRPVVSDGGSYQEVRPHRRVALELADPADGGADELIGRWARTPVPLDDPPVVRGFLAVTAPDEHLLGLTFHHLAVDPSSLRLAVRELGELYAARLQGTTVPALTLQYGEYAQWQAARLAERSEADRASWSAIAAEARPARYARDVEFEPGRAPAAKELRCQLLTNDEIEAVLSWSRRNRSTIFMTLMAAFVRTVAPHADTDDLAITTVFEQRDHPASRGLLGAFIYPAMIRIAVREGEGWSPQVGRIREAVLHAYERAQFPLLSLLELAPQFIPGVIAAEPTWYRLFEYLPSRDIHDYNFGPAVGRIVHSTGNQDDSQEFGLGLRVRRTAEGALVGRLNYDTHELVESSASRLLADFRANAKELAGR